VLFCTRYSTFFYIICIIILFYWKIVQVREELKAEIRYQREVSGRVQKHPDVTTKHGKLKSKRKNPPTTIYVDDLAALDSLSEVYKQ
jgi:hypothetical protein